jgi:hypothetical protein
MHMPHGMPLCFRQWLLFLNSCLLLLGSESLEEIKTYSGCGVKEISRKSLYLVTIFNWQPPLEK